LGNGLAWSLPLDRLWELYVVGYVGRLAQDTGGQLFVGHKGETVFPLQWSNSSVRSLGHLAPDIVLRRAGHIRIFDAKYKAHLADIDEVGWHRLSEEIQESHRADVHQALAYASLFEAPEITTTLVYPLRPSTAAALRKTGKHLVRADLLHGGRQLRLELLGLAFGGIGLSLN
jgi:5-methylcytosine-specific restriction endonuclease McrBC regulatory subunit McrC